MRDVKLSFWGSPFVKISAKFNVLRMLCQIFECHMLCYTNVYVYLGGGIFCHSLQNIYVIKISIEHSPNLNNYLLLVSIFRFERTAA